MRSMVRVLKVNKQSNQDKNMRNAIETYTEMGRKTAEAYFKHDMKTFRTNNNWVRNSVSMERLDDQMEARNAFYSAYKQTFADMATVTLF